MAILSPRLSATAPRRVFRSSGSVTLAALLLAVGPVRAEVEHYRVVPEESHIEYEAEGLLGAVIGRATGIQGELKADRGEAFRTVEMELTLASDAFHSGSDWRDGDLRELLEVTKYPTIRILTPTLLRWTPFPNLNAPTGADGEAVVWVQFRGVQAQEDILFRADENPQSGRVMIRGECESTMHRYRIEPPSAFFYTSPPKLLFRFELTLERVRIAPSPTRGETAPKNAPPPNP